MLKTLATTPRGRRPINLPPSDQEPEKSGLVRASDFTSTDLTRAAVLVHLLAHGASKGPDLAEAAGLPSAHAVNHHVSQMIGFGWLHRPSRYGVALTDFGQVVARCVASWRQESLWRRIIRNRFGRFRRAVARRIEQAGQVLDREYASKVGSRIIVQGGKKRQERKATAARCIRACKRHSVWGDAAREVGLEAGALEQRMRKLLSRGAL